MGFRKGSGLALNLFRYFTSHPARTRPLVPRLVAGTLGLGPLVLFDNASRVPIFSSAEPLCDTTPKLVERVSGIFRLRSPILADKSAKIPVFSALIHHRSRFFGCGACGAKRLYHVDRHQVQHFQQPRWQTRCFKYLRIMALVGSGVLTTAYFRRLETERVLGEFFHHNLKDKTLPRNHPYSIQAQSVFQNIIRSLDNYWKTCHESSTSHLECLNWEVSVVNSDICNACCLPGGKIVLFTGLLEQLKNDEEIAAIIGHEVGHVVAGYWSSIGDIVDILRSLSFRI